MDQLIRIEQIFRSVRRDLSSKLHLSTMVEKMNAYLNDLENHTEDIAKVVSGHDQKTRSLIDSLKNYIQVLEAKLLDSGNIHFINRVSVADP